MFTRLLVAAVTAMGLVLGVAPTAHASGSQLLCSGGGQVLIHGHSDGTYDWVLSGLGACTEAGKPAQARQVNLVGTAVTNGLGLCSSSNPQLSAFSMNVTATFVSLSATRELVSTVQNQVWSLPATTFPIVTGFGIMDADGLAIGGGELETHIFAHCPPDGQPQFQVNWTQAA